MTSRRATAGSYTTPGVYYERVDASGAAIAAVRTDVAGFVGIAQRGPLDVPVPIESYRQFQAHFGDVIGSGYLAYTARAFFENGGRRCWVVRVASRDPLAGEQAASVAPFWIAIDELRDAYGADPGAPRPSRVAVTESDLAPGLTDTLTGGRDGLRLLAPTDFTGEEWAPEDSDEIKAAGRRGFRALGEIDEIAIVAVPDILIHPIEPPRLAPPPPCIPNPCLPHASVPVAAPAPPSPMELPPVFDEDDVYRVQADLVQHCEAKRDRFALLDPPFNAAHDATLGIAGIRGWRQRFDSSMAALYHPWIRVVDPLRLSRSPTRAIPPSGHIAGQIARTDLAIGVHN